MYLCLSIYIHICIYVHMYIYVCIYTYIHYFVCTYTYTNTYTYEYTALNPYWNLADIEPGNQKGPGCYRVAKTHRIP